MGIPVVLKTSGVIFGASGKKFRADDYCWTLPTITRPYTLPSVERKNVYNQRIA